MIVNDSITQGTDEWLQEKLGKPSASNASKIITNAGKSSKQRTDYLYSLTAEIITGQREETYKNANMDMGNDREDESRKLFEMIHGVEVQQVGVVYKDEEKKFLCSPDGIINSEYGLELKNVLGKTQVKYLLKNEVPSEYFSQIQFSLYVTGFKYWMFMSYTPGLRPLIIRVERDEPFLIKLKVELILFCEELEEIVTKIGG